MKPTFALDFRDGQVTLLHRTSRGWSLVGQAAYGAPDFDEALAYMRSTAMGLSPRGITTKLILPGEQILYTPVEVPATDASRRKRLIRLALDGRTPYAVEDLAWDWSGEGTTLQVAVIAKETLAEAEAFAVEHRFNPVSFVAVPAEGQFEGEPFFGMTAAAPGILGEGVKVERDAEPVRQVLREAPKPEPGPAITEADLVPPAEDPRDIEEEEEPLPEQAPPQAEEPAPAEPAQPELDLAEPPPPAAEPVTPPELAEPAAPVAAAPSKAPNAQVATLAVVDPAPEAPMALDVLADPAVEDDLPPAPAAAVSAVLASRAGAAGEEAQPRGMGGVTRPGLARPAPAAAVAKTLPFPGKASGKAAKVKSAGVTAASIPGMPRREKNVVALPNAAASEEGQAKPARPSPVIKGRTPIGGKPRYLGLMLTVGLLILLAGVAAWSSFFMGMDEQLAPEELAPAGQVAPDGTVPEPAATPEATPSPAPDTTEAAATPPAAAETTQAAALPEPTEAEPVAEAAPAAEAPETRLATASAPGGLSQPSGPIALDTSGAPPQLASAARNTANSLGPLVADADSQPLAAPVPPPFGTVYQFDAQGRIIPTPEGILTPEGVLLVAGKPALVPPARPAGLAPPPAATAEVEATVPAAEAEAPPLADPALQGLRPQARPADLAPPDDQQGEAVVLNETDLRLAALRPVARPSGLSPILASATPETAIAADPAGQASLVASGAPLLTAPVTRAPRPPNRPTDLDRAVDEAVTTALDQTEVAAIDEPEPDTAAPDLPNSASVARQATETNALNTRKLSLIAVFGSSSERYAMVLQPNGAVKKVKVGDALDGGRIAAITANSIQYQKGNRIVTLSLPTG